MQRFEDGLNPAYPEQSRIRPLILGYGEISTTFSIPGMPDLAFKRMPPFETIDEIVSHKAAVNRYCRMLTEHFHIRVVDYDFCDLENKRGEKILYVAQTRLPENTIGHQILKTATPQDMEELIHAVLVPLIQIHQFNRDHSDTLSIGIDGQLSNWGFESSKNYPLIPLYFDITTPMLRENGCETLDTEIFLKSCPSFLVWLVRWRFLSEVLDRYHDMRMVWVDLVANFYKEGREDLIDPAIEAVNKGLQEGNRTPEIKPIRRFEIDAYYKNDAFIWSIFLSLRRLDRFLKTRILRRRYNFMLPDDIRR